MTQIIANSGGKADDASPIDSEKGTGPFDKKATRGRKDKVGGSD